MRKACVASSYREIALAMRTRRQPLVVVALFPRYRGSSQARVGKMIFINYRRDDSTAMAGRLHDRLAQRFGRKTLFMDVDNIPPGVDFVSRSRGSEGES